MPKYFMRGTKHESFERMMMSPSRRVQGHDDDDSGEEKNTNERSAKTDDLPSSSQ